ncbi:Gfo/Idh/MocA family protein [Ralstonia pseudosolanacearum]|uniref:Gfo/Idh/MocA family protein n=1 Tax=Ralstonia pseudosolanacearum TaxID=1310165 RepID=UPI000E58E6FE|nr:Gfo/Idh/MocA family oxidoreductase [Ralstonia pseudosolanacearum]AXW50582.1 glucose-fructose oxidoreductase [Ralstonia solanacearum]NKF75758.1 gfo/Idh/MocA family oxidoreductase [Ralstonia solanacearum]BEU54387.1 Gfo/Idh/MocA family oxidoreductase [Ralstonia pseudosolanacearum]BEU59637.1 Gfo/Idh/MocA family oxidoreductase [Ralstonia pseudosolanacearum]BEU64417.1 Gfo/Idh/MocA family oxidoreductase [Ralstonia pseudosolanacearum]
MSTASHEAELTPQATPWPTAQHPVRYAVVGAGWISQAAVLPGVAHSGNAVVTALVTGDAAKAGALAQRYRIGHVCGYADYERLLASGDIDAIYLALPADMHRQYALPALQRGIHVLLEKPMATSEADCEAMIAAARQGHAKLMIAYRLHFEPATLAAIELVRAGGLGPVRAFSAVFSQPVAPSSHRAHHGYWAGPVADMGPYPINTVRHLFDAEPVEVSAVGVRDPASPFHFDDTVGVTLRFADHRLAQFTVSYSSAGVDQYRVIGTRGDLEVSPGFTFGAALRHRLTLDGRTREQPFEATDQVGGALQYFSDCILNDLEPEPGGEEGLADVRILAAIERALESGQPQNLGPFQRRGRIEASQVRMLPAVAAPDLIQAAELGEG